MTKCGSKEEGLTGIWSIPDVQRETDKRKRGISKATRGKSQENGRGRERLSRALRFLGRRNDDDDFGVGGRRGEEKVDRRGALV